MDEEGESVIVASFPKNNREVICIGISEYRSRTLVFIRAYVPSLTGELIPTKNGISLDADKRDNLINGIRALEDVMTSEKIVAQIKKNKREEIRVELSVYKENPLIQIRTYVAYGDTTELKATKKGVAMSVSLLPQLLKSMDLLATATANL